MPGSISIGPAGLPQTVYTNANLAALLAALAVHEVNQPWIIPASTAHIQNLIVPNVTYQFESNAQCFQWARTRMVTAELMNVCLNGGGPQANAWRARYNFIEALRQQFAAAGLANNPFAFLGNNYIVTQQAANHYYIARNGQTVLYAGHLTTADARAILQALNQPPGQQGNPNVAAAAVDEFACAFLAETTRWPEEQVFNLLGLRAAVGTTLTGQGKTLPMTSGTTWEPALGVIGRETPRRIVLFAEQIGLDLVIAQELAAPSLAAFLTGVRVQYQAT
jgi:hypothetical protein